MQPTDHFYLVIVGAALAARKMARMWERLQDRPAHTEEAPLPVPGASLDLLDRSTNNIALPFIEVGKGGPTFASDDILDHLKTRSTPKNHSTKSVYGKESHKWNWPNDMNDWVESEISKDILEVIFRKLPTASLVGFIVSDSIESLILAKLQMATIYRASQDGCDSLLISDNLPLTFGLPNSIGIQQYLDGKASFEDIASFSVDGKAALITDGCQTRPIHFRLQENTYLGLLKIIKRRFKLVLGGFHCGIDNSFNATFLDEADGVFIVANEVEEHIVERWHRVLITQGITYLGWIIINSQFTSPAQSRPWQSPSDSRRVG